MTSTFLAGQAQRPGRRARAAGRRRGPGAGAAGGALHWLTAVGFQVPALVLFGMLVLLPMLFAVYAAFFRWGGFGMPDRLRRRATTSPGSSRTRCSSATCGAACSWSCLSLVLQLPFALALAVRSTRSCAAGPSTGCCSSRPYVLSEAITGVLFSMIFAPDDGLADHVLGAVGLDGAGRRVVRRPLHRHGHPLPGHDLEVLRLPHDALPGRTPVHPDGVDEAAADRRRRALAALPQRHPAAARARPCGSASSCPSSARSSSSTWCGCVTAGGPDHHSETMAVTMFQYGFKRYQVGYASAISVVMFGISLVFALAYQRFVLRRDLEGRHRPCEASDDAIAQTRPARKTRRAPDRLALPCT